MTTYSPTYYDEENTMTTYSPILTYTRVMPKNVLSAVANEDLYSGISGTDQMVAVLNVENTDISEMTSLLGICKHNPSGLWYYHPNKKWTQTIPLDKVVDIINKFHCFVGFSSESLLYAPLEITTKHNCNFGDMIIYDYSWKYDFIFHKMFHNDQSFDRIDFDLKSGTIQNKPEVFDIKFYDLSKPNMSSYIFMKILDKHDPLSKPSIFIYEHITDLQFRCYQSNLEYSQAYWKSLTKDGYRQSHDDEKSFMPLNMRLSMDRLLKVRLDYYKMRNENMKIMSSSGV